ncbi:MAG: GNAT family N-acetyltransferase [Candidatus Cloacimonetes bacterium]|nr:GNAT family N-acetyltransferase [Candidatus Cloacimonadota bacterium]
MNSIIIRDYSDNDFQAITRIWNECGWLEEKMDSTVKEIIGDSRIKVAEIDGAVEASAMATDARMQYRDNVINANVINAVTVSLVARKSGLARKALTSLLADEAERGIPLSVLGMFEQGFYNKLGYGTGNYFRQLHVDPAELNIPVKCRIPTRLTIEDFRAIHQNRLNRVKLHGRFDMLSPIATKSEMEFCKKSFGLGYYNKAGRLTHHLWIDPSSQEHGPYYIMWYAYETNEQLLELLALLQSFNNQVREVSITEPADIQLLDFMKRPIHSKAITKGDKYQNYLNSYAYWQLRILDPIACLQKTSLASQTMELNVLLSDPIEQYLPEDSNWRGCSGEYYLRLGETCEMAKGFRDNLPVLQASINAFSRMWLGLKPASGLAISDDLKAEQSLLKKLDQAFCLPDPQPDWWF